MATELSDSENAESRPGIRLHVLIGVAASLLLLAVYLTVLALTQGPAHALDQTARLWYWMALIVVGFGLQMGLFSLVRSALRQRRASANASVATAGGISAGSMVACCAHHLNDFLPLLGISGLALFLTEYQTVFLLVGVLSNAVGITVMLETIQRHKLCCILGTWNLSMGRIKVIAILLSVLIVILVSLVTWIS